MASVTASITYDDGMTIAATAKGGTSYPDHLAQLRAEAIVACLALVHEAREVAE